MLFQAPAPPRAHQPQDTQPNGTDTDVAKANRASTTAAARLSVYTARSLLPPSRTPQKCWAGFFKGYKCTQQALTSIIPRRIRGRLQGCNTTTESAASSRMAMFVGSGKPQRTTPARTKRALSTQTLHAVHSIKDTTVCCCLHLRV